MAHFTLCYRVLGLTLSTGLIISTAHGQARVALPDSVVATSSVAGTSLSGQIVTAGGATPGVPVAR